jgi:hypothetical protein
MLDVALPCQPDITSATDASKIPSLFQTTARNLELRAGGSGLPCLVLLKSFPTKRDAVEVWDRYHQYVLLD